MAKQTLLDLCWMSLIATYTVSSTGQQRYRPCRVVQDSKVADHGGQGYDDLE
jgi:hypothetical protein